MTGQHWTHRNRAGMQESEILSRGDGPVRRVVRDHPLATFVVLAFAFSWWMVPIAGLPLGSGPFAAAVVVLLMTDGRPGLRGLLQQMTRWRVGWKWYAAAVLLPAGAAVTAAGVTVALGGTMPTASQLGAWTDIPIFFLLVLLVPLLGPWEEPGFRGFALYRLLRDHSPIVSALVVGVIHVVWHLPLFVTGNIPVSDVVLILAASVVFGWLVLGSGGSVLLAMVMHATNNAVSGEYVSMLFSGADAEVLGWARALIWCGFATAVVVFSGRWFRTTPESARPQDVQAPGSAP